MDFMDIKNLAKLIKPPDDETDSSDDDLPRAGIARLGPGDIGKTTKVRGNQHKQAREKEKRLPTNINDIWDINDVPVSNKKVNIDVLSDPRDEPEYDIKYKQAVASEDIFLQLGPKSSATASCEQMVITIHLKGERKDDVDVDVKETQVDIRSPIYRLSLPLPHNVDPHSSKADWDSEKCQLILTLLLCREYDALNF